MKKAKSLSPKEHVELWHIVDNEGFGYYMLEYGPDLDKIAKLGFDKKELENAIKLLSMVEDKIDEADQYFDDEGED